MISYSVVNLMLPVGVVVWSCVIVVKGSFYLRRFYCGIVLVPINDAIVKVAIAL